MKTLFVFNHPAPYKVNVFNELDKIANIDVVFERSFAKDRPDSFYENNEYNFECIFFRKGYFSRENTYSGELKKFIKKHYENYDTIVMNGYSTIAEMRAIRYMIKHDIPYVLQINGGIIKKDFPLKKRLKTYFISHAYRYYSPCQEADNYLIHYGALPKRIFHYPYGNFFDKEILKNPLKPAQKLKIRHKWGLPTNILFVNASQFIERKNNMQLISIFKGREESLLLIGSGKEKEKYEQYIKDNKLTNIIIMDFKKRDELFEILSCADAFITLSHEDIFGHTTLEAMANGLPVISSNKVVSSLDLIEDGKNGFIVDNKSKDLINRAINNIDKLSPKYALEVAHRNTIENTAKALKELIMKR